MKDLYTENLCAHFCKCHNIINFITYSWLIIENSKMLYITCFPHVLRKGCLQIYILCTENVQKDFINGKCGERGVSVQYMYILFDILYVFIYKYISFVKKIIRVFSIS